MNIDLIETICLYMCFVLFVIGWLRVTTSFFMKIRHMIINRVPSFVRKDYLFRYQANGRLIELRIPWKNVLEITEKTCIFLEDNQIETGEDISSKDKNLVASVELMSNIVDTIIVPEES